MTVISSDPPRFDEKVNFQTSYLWPSLVMSMRSLLRRVAPSPGFNFLAPIYGLAAQIIFFVTGQSIRESQSIPT